MWGEKKWSFEQSWYNPLIYCITHSCTLTTGRLYMCEEWTLNGFHQALPWLLSNLFRALEVDASCWGDLPPGDTTTRWKQVKRTGHRFPLDPRESLAPTGCIIVNFHLKKQNSIHSCSISTHKSRFLEAVSLMSLQNKRQNQSFI